MRLLLLLLLASATASAQPALFPDGPGRRIPAVPNWRACVGAGLTADGEAGVFSLGAERTVWGPLALGVRGGAFARRVWETDRPEPSDVNWTAETLASVSTRDRRLDLRAFVGFGAASVGVPAGFGFAEFGASAGPQRIVEIQEFVTGGIGADLYLTAGVGVGAEVRGVSSLGRPQASEASLGLRFRLPK